MAMFRYSGDIGSRPPMGTKSDRQGSDRAVYCNICLDSWDSETEVEIHRSTAHKSELMDLLRDSSKNVCKICVKPNDDKDRLVEHIKTWHLYSGADAVRVEREIFICDSCCAVFFNKRLLQAHILISHTNVNREKTFTECPKCLKPYRLKTIWYHFQGHNIQSVSCCKICMTKCKDRLDLLAHVDGHLKHLFCDICQYQSKSEAFFAKHLATRHRREQTASRRRARKWQPYFMPRASDYKARFQCDTASKGLQLELFADVELRVCVLCREICIGEDDALAHLENEHVEREQPQTVHTCICGETFSSKVLLKYHMFKNDHSNESNDTDVVYAIVLVPDEVEMTTSAT
ncbi:unnamed protein product, partial [Iphiclides podalirius]